MHAVTTVRPGCIQSLRSCLATFHPAALAVLWLLTAAMPIPLVCAAQETPSEAVTYRQGIDQVLRRNCVSCHSPEGGAPFNLLSYADAKQWGDRIQDVTQSRYMPPWLPVPDLHSAQPAHTFQGDRRLSDADREALQRWVVAGMPEGTTADNAVPDGQTKLEQAGHPDLVLMPAQPMHVPASGPDIFVTFAVPFMGASSHIVRAIAIEVSDPHAAHSVFIGVDEKRSLRKGFPQVLTTGLPGMEFSPQQTERFAPGGQLLLWTPDAPALKAAGPWTLHAGSDLVLTAHIKTTGKAEELSFRVLLYYAKTSRVPSHVLLRVDSDEGFEIAAGEKQFKLEAQTTLEAAQIVAVIYPRAHYAASSMEAYATLPNGSRRDLLTIDRWDVDWVSVYRFVKPVALPKGAVIHVSFVYDNSSGNPHNPSDPPKKIVTGHSAKEERAEVWMETSATQ